MCRHALGLPHTYNALLQPWHLFKKLLMTWVTYLWTNLQPCKLQGLCAHCTCMHMQAMGQLQSAAWRVSWRFQAVVGLHVQGGQPVVQSLYRHACMLTSMYQLEFMHSTVLLMH